MAFIYFVTQIQFEFGAIKLLKQECERVGITRPLIVTDPGVKAADIIQPDVGNTGGIMEGKKIAAMAEAYNMRVTPHNCGSALSTAASLQASACIANFMTLEIYPYFPQQPGYLQVLKDSPEDRVAKGFLSLTDEPGLGVELASKRVRPFLFAECR